MANLLQSVFLYYLVFVTQTVFSDGNVEIRLIKYETDGNLVNGRPCDIIPPPQCDIAIKFCLSTKDKKCAVRLEGQVSEDANTVEFTKGSFETFQNPIVFPAFYLNEEDMSIDISTYDLDDVNFFNNDGAAELIDKFHFQLNLTEPNATNFLYVEGIANQKPTKLTFSYQLICDERFYGPACDDYCNVSFPFSCEQTVNETVYNVCVESSLGYDNCRFECPEECDYSLTFNVVSHKSDNNSWSFLLNKFWFLIFLLVLTFIIIVASPCILWYFFQKRGTRFVVNKA